MNKELISCISEKLNELDPEEVLEYLDDFYIEGPSVKDLINTLYDKDYWKPSFYTWDERTVEAINEQLRNQIPMKREENDY